MIEKNITCDMLATLIVVDSNMEPTPEPFRCQNNLTLIVDFSEYVKFIDRFLGKVDYLATKTSILKEYRNSNNTAGLIQAFYTDMALAVAKEVYFSEMKKTKCTNILHSISNASVKTTEEIVNVSNSVKKYLDPGLRSLLEQKGYKMPYIAYNNDMWDYAIVLYYSGAQSSQRWIKEV